MTNAEAISQRMAEFEARADREGMSPARRDLEMRKVAWGKSYPGIDFMLAHGRDYKIGPDSFALPRGPMKQCFMNATHLALDDPDMTYVEGKVFCHGIGIDHAWCVDDEGFVHDPTIPDNSDGHISNYFGVPFNTAYLRKAIFWNKVYGLLDAWSAPKTAPKLYELGLEAGQRWLIDQPLKPPRKKRKVSE